ncbi:MAG: hypothetical protein J1F66_03525 [Clostridiales bacterium]|nr:hypothetical protein [Clostridiales bacterium]
MLLTNEQREQISQLFSNNGGWLIRTNASSKDIEVCGGEATPDPTTNTCARCVAANKTAYKPNSIWTITHPNCKCYNTNGNVSVQLDFPMSKLTGHLFKDVSKTKMMHK